MTKKIFLLLALLFVFNASFAQQSEKEKDILKFLNINGGRDASEMMLNQVFAAFKKLKPNVPISFWEEARKEFTVDELQSMLLPIYNDLFTHEEIKELVAFYETETGIKMARLTNEITFRSTKVGEDFGRNLAEQILKRIEEKGYE